MGSKAPPVVFILLAVFLFCILPVSAGYFARPLTKEDCVCPSLGVTLDDERHAYSSYAFVRGLHCTFYDEEKEATATIKFQNFHSQGNDLANAKLVAQDNFDYHAPTFIPSVKTSDSNIIHIPQKQATSTSYVLESTRTFANLPSLFTAGKMYLYQDTVLVEVHGRGNVSVEHAMSRRDAAESCVRSIIGTTHADESGGKKLHGTVTFRGTPVRHAKIELEDPAFKNTVATDNDGKFEFPVDLQQGKTYTMRIYLTYWEEDNHYIVLYDAHQSSTNDIETRSYDIPELFYEKQVTVRSDNDYTQDTDLGDEPAKSVLVPENVQIYLHFTEILDFYRDTLRQDLVSPELVKVYPFVQQPGIAGGYDEKLVAIIFSPDLSLSTNPNRPLNREYHEYNHFVMHNIYQRTLFPRTEHTINNVNHGGFTNPSTADSYSEGFAEFMALAAADTNGYECTGQYASIASVEPDNKAWDAAYGKEELAVAGILWDLYDSKDQITACAGRMKIVSRKNQLMSRLGRYSDDDKVSLSLAEIWSVLKNNHPDMTSVYNAFITKYPAKKQDIDQIFISHGFFKDTTEGNRTYDRWDPYRDSNPNGIHDDGELFIDLAGRDPVYEAGDIVGTASNYQRPWRTNFEQTPGHYIKVTNNVPFYTIKVSYPGREWLDTEITAENTDGLVYVHVPPADSGAQVTLTGQDVSTGSPLTYTSEEFYRNYERSAAQGYYVEHDFKITGPIPTRPAGPYDGLSAGSPAGLPDLLTVKGPLLDLLTKDTRSRVPLVISVPIVIAALLVLAYVLKKQ